MKNHDAKVQSFFELSLNKLLNSVRCNVKKCRTNF